MGRWLRWGALLTALVFASGCGGSSGEGTTSSDDGKSAPRPISLLNVSYDPTREFYQEFNEVFAAYWRSKTGQEVTVEQSHGGSGKQARAVIDGLEADVVTLALAYDIAAIADKGHLLDADWQERLPHNSAPYTSTIVFLVRKGNPKQIRDWSDLTKPGVEIVTPNPKTGGGARWNYLAAWGYALKRELGDLQKLRDPSAAAEVEAAQAKAQTFVAAVYKQVVGLDSSARAATNTFIQREVGDVLLTWENEALLAVKDLGADQVEMVTPSVSILAEPPVAVVTKNATKHGTLEVSQAYLEHLYSPEAQQLAAKHFYRPVDATQISAEQRRQFAQIELFSIDDVFGGWAEAQRKHFNDGGVFDQIYQPGS